MRSTRVLLAPLPSEHYATGRNHWKIRHLQKPTRNTPKAKPKNPRAPATFCSPPSKTTSNTTYHIGTDRRTASTFELVIEPGSLVIRPTPIATGTFAQYPRFHEHVCHLRARSSFVTRNSTFLRLLSRRFVGETRPREPPPRPPRIKHRKTHTARTTRTCTCRVFSIRTDKRIDIVRRRLESPAS